MTRCDGLSPYMTACQRLWLQTSLHPSRELICLVRLSVSCLVPWHFLLALIKSGVTLALCWSDVWGFYFVLHYLESLWCLACTGSRLIHHANTVAWQTQTLWAFSSPSALRFFLFVRSLEQQRRKERGVKWPRWCRKSTLFSGRDQSVCLERVMMGPKK